MGMEWRAHEVCVTDGVFLLAQKKPRDLSWCLTFPVSFLQWHLARHLLCCFSQPTNLLVFLLKLLYPWPLERSLPSFHKEQDCGEVVFVPSLMHSIHRDEFNKLIHERKSTG